MAAITEVTTGACGRGWEWSGSLGSDYQAVWLGGDQVLVYMRAAPLPDGRRAPWSPRPVQRIELTSADLETARDAVKRLADSYG